MIRSAAHLPNASRRAFVLSELLILLFVAIATFALLSLSLSDSRRNARLGQDLASLRHYGMGTVAYSADYNDLMWGFSWQVGTTPGADPDLQVAPSNLQACANQAVQILRDRAGRTDIMSITSWFAHPMYSPLVLADYNAMAIPAHAAVSSADENRLKWRDDPAGFDAGVYTPRPYLGSMAANADKRWPYSSSWRVGIAFTDRTTVVSNKVRWGTSQQSYTLPAPAVFGAPRLSDVAFPSQKAHMFDEFQRHHGQRQAFYGYAEARVPVLAADGAVSVRTTGDGNIGGDPASPANPGENIRWFSFLGSSDTSRQWFPQPLNGAAVDSTITDRLMWTRGGILGRDFDGPEIDTGQW